MVSKGLTEDVPVFRTVRVKLAAVISVALAATATPALSQEIATTDEVMAFLDDGCSTQQLIEIVGVATLAGDNLDACEADILQAIDVANAYAALTPPDEPPQVEIGFMLCQLGVTREQLQPFILASIDASGNELLLVGCSAAIQPAAGGAGVNSPG